jgi:mRNA interferase RelE/StbE
MSHGLRLTPLAKQMLIQVGDRRERELLRERILQLAEDPDKQGKALVGELIGFRSVRAVGQRYRIVYRVEKAEVVVLVVGLGRRQEGGKKDVYNVLKKLLRAEVLQ